MKTFVSTFILLSCFLFSFYGNANGSSAGEQARSENAQIVQIYTTPELAELTNQWTLAFGKSNPNVKVDVIETNSESDFSDGELRFTTRVAENEPAWKMVVGHDIVVPVFNAKNPFFGKLNEKGLTSNDFAEIISEETNWADLIQDGNNAAIHTLIS
ncbi:MAG: substrate-binding domain-containing protein, partial [Mariniphaga sp.]